MVLPQRPLPPEAPNTPRQDTESKTLGWGRVPGSIDSRAGPHGYGLSVYRPSLGGSGSLKTFRPSAKHRAGSVWHVVTGGKPNARRGKHLWGESCIFRLYSLELPFLLRTSLRWSVCATSRMGFTPVAAQPWPGQPCPAWVHLGVGLQTPTARVVFLVFAACPSVSVRKYLQRQGLPD